MNEYGKLRASIRHLELSEQSFKRAREDYRQAVRDYVAAQTARHGESVKLAKRLGISESHLWGIKTGFTVVSFEWAKKLMDVCEGD